jgi:hypothetical protein
VGWALVAVVLTLLPLRALTKDVIARAHVDVGWDRPTPPEIQKILAQDILDFTKAARRANIAVQSAKGRSLEKSECCR